MDKPVLIKPPLAAKILGISQFHIHCLMRDGTINGIISGTKKKKCYHIITKDFEEKFKVDINDYLEKGEKKNVWCFRFWPGSIIRNILWIR